MGSPLPSLLRHGAHSSLDAATARETKALDELERALHTRLFAVADLYPRRTADDLVTALRRAIDNPEPLPTGLRTALGNLHDGARRWHDTLA
ncbi:hypothetical protein [Streptomyces sp. NPDC051993]|uniref:hypothetical protein n=1 Tax=Streptomyces sp. NPDC051993 TaxID=3155286 RepID=UPI00342AA174